MLLVLAGNERNITQIAIIVTTVIILILVISLCIFLEVRKRKPKDYFQGKFSVLLVIWKLFSDTLRVLLTNALWAFVIRPLLKSFDTIFMKNIKMCKKKLVFFFFFFYKKFVSIWYHLLKFHLFWTKNFYVFQFLCNRW